jgi:flap endonuclease-1
MGIRNLNKYLKKNCKKSINNVHLSELGNKTIIIDTSIYLYRFITEGSLIENIYQMITILLKYNIEPIFVFDGKPPIEKNGTINQRKNERETARDQYKVLEQQLNNNISVTEKKNILKEMNLLKRQIVSIKKKDIYDVKELINSFGVKYVDSQGEADELCAYLVNNNKGWGCLSDDTDMFVYGCKYVLRELNLINHSVYVYNTSSILNELDITENDFKDILILSSTEYDNNINIRLIDILNVYQKYKSEKFKYVYSFYIWLLKKTNYIENYELLLNTYKLYTNSKYNMNNIKINTSEKNLIQIQNIMSKEGFLFI